jgi:hypothetical protein
VTPDFNFEPFRCHGRHEIGEPRDVGTRTGAINMKHELVQLAGKLESPANAANERLLGGIVMPKILPDLARAAPG